MAVLWLTAFIDHAAAESDSVAKFWQSVTGSTLSVPRGERRQFATLLPPTGDPYLRVQERDADPAGLHIDLHVDDPPTEADRAEGLGATRFEGDGPVIMRSPAGMIFCLVRHHGESERPGLTEGSTASYTFDQVSIDIPHDAFEAECEFWAALTGWALHGGSVPEFRLLARPEGMPLRILLQRLGHDDTGTTARAHLDAAVGTNGESIASWHTSLGATVLGRGRHWITLSDPAGLPYCLTERDPITGSLSLSHTAR
jgi:hypothetical protein